MTTTARRRLRGEDGVTLVELLTAMTVSAVVLALVTGTVVNALRSQRRQTQQVAALNEAKMAFERVTRDIRRADPVQGVALDRITLDVRPPGTAARTVTYERVGGSLVVTEGSTVARPLVGNLASGQPLFLFHLANGSTSTGEETVNPRSVRSVTVRLQVDPPGAGRVVDLTNRVVVRNAS